MMPVDELLRLSDLLSPAPVPLQQVVGVAASNYLHHDDAANFNLYQHLGNLSPYFDSPSRLPTGEPPTCSVTKAFLIHRHGSRHPLTDELPLIDALSAYLANNTDLFSRPTAPLPQHFSFLTRGWKSDFTTDDLAPAGRAQLFDHGVALRLRFPDLHTTTLLAGGQDRVVESAQWFALGYFGREANHTAKLNVIAESRGAVSWVTPAYTCPAWSYALGDGLRQAWDAVYLPRIAERLNALLRPAFQRVAFTAEHAHGMLYACAYGTAVHGAGTSPWCAVFTREEILEFEYELDLLMRGAFGYALPRDMGGVMGSLAVGNVTGFFLRDDEKEEEGAGLSSLSLNFGHDTTISVALTALGLAADAEDEYPVEGPPRRERKWRTAYQEPFGARMLFKLLSCEESADRIQLELNGANIDLAPVGCKTDEYGACIFEEFLQTERVQAAVCLKPGGEEWKAACSK